MKLFDLIYQTTNEKLVDHSEDSQPSKIKEKEESLQNTLINRLTIPIKMEEQEIEKEEPVIDEYEQSYVEEPIKEEPVVETKDTMGNEALFDIVNSSYTKVLDGNEKAINVKESMLNNMKQKNKVLVEVDLIQERKQEEQPKEAEIQEKLNFLLGSDGIKKDETPVIEEKIEEKSLINEMPNEIRQQLSDVVDLDATFVEINETRTKIMDITKKADIAEQEATESDKILQEMSSKYSEAEKELEKSKLRSREMEQKILSMLNNEKNKLSQQLQEKEVLINDANKRKEQNDNRIVDYQSRINSTREKANEINERISHQQELLNALGYFDNSETASFDEEQNARRVA